MARTSLETWEERQDELRRQANPEMDQLVHRYYQDHQELEDVRSLVLQMLSELGEAKRNPAAEPTTTAGQAGDHLSALLDRVSDLATENLTRRVAETGQMLIDVMGVRGPDACSGAGSGTRPRSGCGSCTPASG